MRFCLPVEHLENDSCYLDSLLVGGVWLELGLDSIVVAPGQCVRRLVGTFFGRMLLD